MEAELLPREISGSLKLHGKWPIKASWLVLFAMLLPIDNLISTCYEYNRLYVFV